MEPIELRKLFVGGVSRETNEDTLTEHFSQYGTVQESLVIRHRLTGLGRGFGFVIFSSISMADETLRHENHVILGKRVEVKRAIPKGDRQEESNGYISHDGNCDTEINTKKIFVGGLPHDLKEEEFYGYFESFGAVTDAVVIPDKVTNRPRGFGFITFDSEDSVDNVMQNRFHKLKNKMVEVKVAHPKARNDEYMNYYDCNNTSLGIGGYYYCYPNFQTYYCYNGWSFYGFGGWGSPSNSIGSSSSHGILASVNPAVHNNYICNGSCDQMAVSTASGNSNGDFNFGIVEVMETTKSAQIDDLSSLEHQEGEMDDSLSSKSNAAEHQIVEIHDSTVQISMPRSTKSEQNGPSSHGIPDESYLYIR